MQGRVLLVANVYAHLAGFHIPFMRLLQGPLWLMYPKASGAGDTRADLSPYRDRSGILEQVGTKCPTVVQCQAMATDKKAEVWLGKQGRLVIPAPLRRALGLEPGERLIASVEDGRLILERRREILSRVKARFSQVPAEVGLADELITERRAEARKDDPE